MTITKKAKDKAVIYSPDVFGESTIKAIESIIQEKNGKQYIKCQVRDRDVIVKPEEKIRQLWIHHLTQH